jgi:hypothetical protein
MTQLTDNQRALILLAVETDGRIERFPDNLRGGARKAVTLGLLAGGLLQGHHAGFALTDAAYEAVGLPVPAKGVLGVEEAEEAGSSDEGNANTQSDGSDDDIADVEAGDTATGPSGETAAPTPAKVGKPNRIDQVVALLMRPQGVTIKEVMAATDWQQHSVRGFFAGTLKKKGYTVINEKAGKEDRVYRIQTEEAKEAERAAAPTTGDEEE